MQFGPDFSKPYEKFLFIADVNVFLVDPRQSVLEQWRYFCF